MNLLFTGASSFSGLWLASELAETGHRVFCTFSKPDISEYEPLRLRRVRHLLANENIIPLLGAAAAGAGAALDAFEDVRRAGGALPAGDPVRGWNGSIDGFCAHGAFVGDYKNPGFDAIGAAARNTAGLPELCERLRRRGCRFLLHTGTYFESGEGVDGAGAAAFSPYAVSKKITWEISRFYAERAGMAVGKFVMPNPFGAWEGRGFTAHLARTWLAGGTPVVRAPEYVRDNAPVPLLAQAYLAAVEAMDGATRAGGAANTATVGAVSPPVRFTPSGFVGKQGDFARLVAGRFARYWGRECPLEIARQPGFDEPRRRANSAEGIADGPRLDAFWEDFAAFHSENFRQDSGNA